MKRVPMRLLVILMLLWAPIQVHALAQHNSRPQSGSADQRGTQAPSQNQGSPARSAHQGRNTWYEFLLKQFNPDDLDYGQWIEQRRQAFLQARVRNPYFAYSFGVTLALLLALGICTKLWIDHRRAMWITAEMMTDICSHDQRSREIARAAIDKYNDHIERCNRAIEGAAHGIMTSANNGSEADALRIELQRVAAERDRYLQERDAAKSELEAKGKILAELSLRLDGIASKTGANGDSQSTGLRNSDPAVVKHINNLQEQLYSERQKNRQLKGA